MKKERAHLRIHFSQIDDRLNHYCSKIPCVSEDRWRTPLRPRWDKQKTDRPMKADRRCRKGKRRMLMFEGQRMRSWNRAGQNSAGSLKAIDPLCVHALTQCNSQRACVHTQTHTHSTLVSEPWGAAEECLETRSSSAEHENASETFLWHHQHRIKVSEDQSRVMQVNCTVKSTHHLHCTCYL